MSNCRPFDRIAINFRLQSNCASNSERKAHVDDATTPPVLDWSETMCQTHAPPSFTMRASKSGCMVESVMVTLGRVDRQKFQRIPETRQEGEFASLFSLVPARVVSRRVSPYKLVFWGGTTLCHLTRTVSRASSPSRRSCRSGQPAAALQRTLAGRMTGARRELLDWLGGPFDPRRFSVAQANARLAPHRTQSWLE